MGPEHKEMLRSFIEEKEDDLKKHLVGWKFELLRLGLKEIIESLSGEEKRRKNNLLSMYQQEILEKPEIENKNND